MAVTLKDLLLIFSLFLGSSCATVGDKERKWTDTSEYWRAFLNITYPIQGVLQAERTETGRFSSGTVVDVHGQAVELKALNQTEDEEEDVYTGCQGPFVPNWPTDRPWIAVIRRGKCTFNTKISNAIGLNASGVLVYDNELLGELQSMKVERFPIPSVFTYSWKGLELVGLIRKQPFVELSLQKGSHCRVRAAPLGPLNNGTMPTRYCTPSDAWEEFQHILKKQWNWNATVKNGEAFNVEKRTSVLFVSVSFIVLMLISLAWLVFYYIQRFRYIHAKDQLERKLCSQAKRALAIISTNVLKKDDLEMRDFSETCAVCIENYRVADVVRILPCKHQFHKSCIDQWLLEKRTCPMCKMDILKHYGLIEEAPDEREETVLNLA